LKHSLHVHHRRLTEPIIQAEIRRRNW